MTQMTIKKQFILMFLVVFFLSGVCFGELIEKIHAVVNGETITYSELKSFENQMKQVLAQQFKGEELKQKLEEMKAGLLDNLIQQKLLLSHALDKEYDVDAELDMIIQDIKKQNSIKSDEELKQALAAQGSNFDDWKKQIKESRIQQRFVYEEIGSKIKIDNPAIMAYYKENIKEFTIPAKVELDCIFLNKSNYLAPKALRDKMELISARLGADDFFEVATKYSELPGAENNYYLGEFKEGELDAGIEKVALELKKDQTSDWIETDSGWYLIRLKNRVESKLVEYKTVREEIEHLLRNKEQDKRLEVYLEELKKDSHIKIYETY